MATRGSGGTEGSGGSYDPRYDPAFQRGFGDADREVGGGSTRLPARPSARPMSTPDPHAEPGVDPGESSWFAGTGSASAWVEPSVPAAGSPAAGTAGPAVPAADPEAEERAEAARARAHRIWTAYTVGLSALSAACMAFGVVLVTRAYGVFNSTTVDSRDDIYWAQLGGQFGPWVFVVGLATGIGVLFLHAARWRPPPE